jgi:dihydrofolate reductase
MPKPIITLIAAIADNGVIGSHNSLPWYLPEDLKRFKKLTEGKTVVMGKKTFDSIVTRLGKPLPNRVNVVLTRQDNLDLPDGVLVIHEPKDIENIEANEIMIIGGGQVYQELINQADKLHITHVHQKPEGDIVFPAINWQEWNKVFEEVHDGYTFSDYERIK